MAEQICPKCKQQTFTWTYDDESIPHTYWHCRHCDYEAWEDESFERICESCGTKTESLLEDSVTRYWWCSRCNTTVQSSIA